MATKVVWIDGKPVEVDDGVTWIDGKPIQYAEEYAEEAVAPPHNLLIMGVGR